VKTELARHLPTVNKAAPKGSLGDDEVPTKQKKQALEREAD
jgi:hypothetical protein